MNNKRVWANLVAIATFFVFPWYAPVIVLLLGNILIRNYWESLVVAVVIDFLLSGAFIAGYDTTLADIKLPLIFVCVLTFFTVRNTFFKEKHWYQ